MKAFISHITEEAALANVLKEWIESAFLDQVSVFVSSEDEDITAGEQWFRRIQEALSDASVLVVICSPDSIFKSWINFEAGAGWIKGIPVIPVCHSGMTKSTLPVPLSFFQALDANQDGFSQKIMAALARHFGFQREPRIPFNEMSNEIREALSLMPAHEASEEEMGFFDHLVAMGDGFSQLANIVGGYGEHTNVATVEARKYQDQVIKAQANKSEGTERHLQKIARRFGEKLAIYAEQLQSLNREYQIILPETENSLQFVINFQSPVNEEDWAAIQQFLKVLDEAEANIVGFRDTAKGVHQIMNEQPNYQRHLKRAIREVGDEYSALVENLDSTLEMMQQARAVLKSLA